MKTIDVAGTIVRMTKRMDRFVSAFYSKLGRASAWDAFLYVAHNLSQKTIIQIVETGVDGSNGFTQDISTLVWSWIGDNWDADVVSVDERMQRVREAMPNCPGARIELRDPREFLEESYSLVECDLLFLNSSDLTVECLTQAKVLRELATAWERLPEGCLVAIPTRGNRHKLAEDYMRGAATKRIDGTIVVWEKN